MKLIQRILQSHCSLELLPLEKLLSSLSISFLQVQAAGSSSRVSNNVDAGFDFHEKLTILLLVVVLPSYDSYSNVNYSAVVQEY